MALIRSLQGQFSYLFLLRKRSWARELLFIKEKHPEQCLKLSFLVQVLTEDYSYRLAWISGVLDSLRLKSLADFRNHSAPPPTLGCPLGEPCFRSYLIFRFYPITVSPVFRVWGGGVCSSPNHSKKTPEVPRSSRFNRISVPSQPHRCTMAHKLQLSLSP